MSPKPLLVSGRKLAKIFQQIGYEKISQRGSHIKMKNYATGSVAIIPDHKELDRWTLKPFSDRPKYPTSGSMNY